MAMAWLGRTDGAGGATGVAISMTGHGCLQVLVCRRGAGVGRRAGCGSPSRTAHTDQVPTGYRR